MTYPLSRTNNANHILSRLLSSLFPYAEAGSTASKPSNSSAFLAAMQSDFGTPLIFCILLGDGTISLFSDKSMATVSAIAIYEQVASSAQCFPGDIHGILTIKAKTISGDLFRCIITRSARFLQWTDNLLARAAVLGRKRAAAARRDVKRNAERERTNDAV
jgi:hypothetical protein